MRQEELKYSADHMWVAVEGEQARVGITEYAQNQLGEVVFIEFLDVGNRFLQGKAFAHIESVKSVGDLNAPVTGEVVEINRAAIDSPDAVNRDPFGEGWLALVKMEKTAELDGLMGWEAYKESLQE
jgi:glycine cleavage system H protein